MSNQHPKECKLEFKWKNMEHFHPLITLTNFFSISWLHMYNICNEQWNKGPGSGLDEAMFRIRPAEQTVTCRLHTFPIDNILTCCYGDLKLLPCGFPVSCLDFQCTVSIMTIHTSACSSSAHWHKGSPVKWLINVLSCIACSCFSFKMFNLPGAFCAALCQECGPTPWVGQTEGGQMDKHHSPVGSHIVEEDQQGVTSWLPVNLK